MKQYAINDTIVHPTHGIGRIVGIKHEELVEGFEHFYMIEITEKTMIIHIPMRKMEKVGIRLTMSSAEFPQVLDTLRSKPDQLSDDYKTRQKDIRDRLSGGLPVDIAEVVRDLTWHQKRIGLTKADSDLLTKSLTLLADEVAVIQNISHDDATDLIKQTLAEMDVGTAPDENDEEQIDE
jgi:CarD family transcriptional regulator